MTYLPLQTALKGAGYDPGPLDGMWGARTFGALMAYSTGQPLTSVINGAATAMIGPMVGKDITTPKRIVNFIAQLAHESTGFTRLKENLNYSVEGLLVTFSRARISLADAQRLGRTPSRPADLKGIANIVYGGAYGIKNLGNTQPGDGAAYIGRGFIMVTGRANYETYGKLIGLNLLDHPELASEPDVAGRIAVEFWNKHNLNALADRDDIEGITEAINGGDNGLDERKAILARLKRISGL